LGISPKRAAWLRFFVCSPGVQCCFAWSAPASIQGFPDNAFEHTLSLMQALCHGESVYISAYIHAPVLDERLSKTLRRLAPNRDAHDTRAVLWFLRILYKCQSNHQVVSGHDENIHRLREIIHRIVYKAFQRG